MNALSQVLGAIRAFRFRYTNEDELQAGLHAALRNAGLEPEREVRLNTRDRIDLLVERVGIEVKVAGSAETVLRQVRRYAESDRIDALVLVTNRVRHLRLPTAVNGKPVEVVTLVGAGL